MCARSTPVPSRSRSGSGRGTAKCKSKRSYGGLAAPCRAEPLVDPPVPPHHTAACSEGEPPEVDVSIVDRRRGHVPRLAVRPTARQRRRSPTGARSVDVPMWRPRPQLTSGGTQTRRGIHEHHDHHARRRRPGAEGQASRDVGPRGLPRRPTEIIADLGPVLVEATGIGAGQRVLDVAAGSGNVAIPAAATGAHVIASDLTRELFDQGRADAEARGCTSTGGRPTSKRCRSTTARSTRSRRVWDHVRAAPPARSRRAGPGVSARREDRVDRVDPERASSGSCSRP